MTIPVLTLLTLVLCFGILAGAVLAVRLNNMVSAVISAGLSSLFASVVYVVLAAPDVAMTEASIGSGLTTMIFLYAIRKTQQPAQLPESHAEDNDTTTKKEHP